MNVVNIYFYRVINPDNVIDSWPGCTAVPRFGDIVELGNRPDHSVWKVEQTIWSRPNNRVPQVVDVHLSLISPAR